VTPYADFTYFGLLLYAVVPTLVLGLLGRATWRWALLLTAIILVIQYQAKLKIGAHAEVREIWIVIAFGFCQWAAMRAYAAMGARGGSVFYATMAVCLLPLVLAKVIPVLLLRQFGFLGLSYITFRALDVIFCLRDGVIAAPRVCDFFGFLFFFPTISAGPIDRYRRFEGDWKRRRTRDEFVSDLDAAVHRIFRGFLYKFILGRVDQAILAGSRRLRSDFRRTGKLYVRLQLLSVFRFRGLQRLCHSLQLPSRRSHTGKFQPPLPSTQYSRFLEPLAYHAFLLVPGPRLHAFSAGDSQGRSMGR
jgi:hypothetical protein